VGNRSSAFLAAVLLLLGVGFVLLFRRNPDGAELRSSAAVAASEACKLEAGRPRRGVLSTRMSTVKSGRYVFVFELKSDNGLDSYWYMESSDPPLKDHAGQRIFRVGTEPLKVETVETDRRVLQTGKKFRSYALLTNEKLQAADASGAVAGRYPLASKSVVTQVNGDSIKGGSHLTSVGAGQAVDLQAPPGTSVLAFGAGTVMFAEDGYDDQLPCASGHARNFGNQIAVLQDDGYEAIYGHLQMGSILLKEGMRVERGQPLAKLGHIEGYASSAHLHFQLGGLTDKGPISVPVAFENQKRTSVILPKEGQHIRLFEE
jgi:murein DD-endopeptidase MepM/ murein hydrolase activator NlpD